MFNKRKGYLLTILIISVISIAIIYKQFFVEDKPKVVVVLKNSNLQYWDIVKAGADKGFEDFNIEGKVIAPKRESVKEQREILKKVLKERPDVLVVAPINTANIKSELEEFVKQGIPVLFIHTDDYWKDRTSYIGTNNFELGRKAGILMASQLQPGDQVALLGRTAEVDDKRLKGAKASLDAVGIKVVTEISGLSIDHPEIIEIRMETVLKEHPDLKGVITSTDYIALPALNVMMDHGLEIPVTGTDGITEMLQLIEKGTISSAVVQNPYDMGYLSTQTALRVSKGETVNKTIDSGVDLITKENVKQRIDFINHVLK